MTSSQVFPVSGVVADHSSPELELEPKPLWIPDPPDDGSSPLMHLDDDAIWEILKILTPPIKLTQLEERTSLSVESFFETAPPTTFDVRCTRGQGSFCLGPCCIVRRLRLVCRRFNDCLGRGSQFVRLRIQFSPEDFDKLQYISRTPRLAGQVQQFSYLMPRFYRQDQQWFERMLGDFIQASATSTTESARRADQLMQPQLRIREGDIRQIKSTMARAETQRRIINEGVDLEQLLGAFSKFKGLQQIRLMRLVDPVDAGWMGLIRRNPTYGSEFESFGWPDAFQHAVDTLCTAVGRSGASVTRFSSLFLDPPTPVIISPGLQSKVSRIARDLESLEIQLIDNRDLDEKVRELSGLFRLVFNELVKLSRLHIGFGRRVSIPLEMVFHEVTFDNLIYLGLHMWHTNSTDLIRLLKRHRAKLIGVRLRHILLDVNPIVDGSETPMGAWKAVLEYMRREIVNLGWVSLRGIGYDGDVQAEMGMHPIPTWHQQALLPNDSDSEMDDNRINDGRYWPSSDEEDSEDEADGINDEAINDTNHANVDVDDNILEDATNAANMTEVDMEVDDADAVDAGNHADADIEDNISENATDSGASAFEPDSDIEADINMHVRDGPNPDQAATQREDHTFRQSRPSRSSDLASRCRCDEYAWQTLDDNGTFVTREQWKRWEKWTHHFCSLHDPS